MAAVLLARAVVAVPPEGGVSDARHMAGLSEILADPHQHVIRQVHGQGVRLGHRGCEDEPDEPDVILVPGVPVRESGPVRDAGDLPPLSDTALTPGLSL